MRVRRKKPFVVLGCGPAGLFAAEALRQADAPFEIHSRRRKSDMFGAQYLHKPIPMLSPDFDSPWPIEYMLRGDAEGYRYKVYGPLATIKVSPESLLGRHDAWDIRAAYDEAWKRFAEQIRDVPSIDAAYVASLTGHYRVVSSIPAPAICKAKHNFPVQNIWAIGDAPERDVWCPVTVEPWTVVCDGTFDTGWYRASNIFGYKTCEWPFDVRPPIEGIARVGKPLKTNCDCFPGIVRVGRYGTWEKESLSHQAYTKVWSLL